MRDPLHSALADAPLRVMDPGAPLPEALGATLDADDGPSRARHATVAAPPLEVRT